MIAGTKLGSVFNALRKMGYICRANYKCCGGCAGAAIGCGVEEKIDQAQAAGKTPKLPKGAIFYHAQDAERIRNAYGRKGWDQNANLYLKFGSIGTEKHGEIGKPTAQVGQDLFYALQAAGIETEWDGDDGRCIVVKIASAFTEAEIPTEKAA